jgi:outer membrane protein assembly factor BamB
MRSLISFVFMMAVLPLQAADWPQFLGPKRDSTTTESIKPWKANPTEVWSVELGESHSAPVLKDGVVYAFFKMKDADADTVAAFDAKTGKELWAKSYKRAKFSNPFGNGPRGTPCVDGDVIYTLGCTGVLAAWKTKDGEQLWNIDLLDEFKVKNLFFGVSTSPTVVGDRVICMVGGTGSGIVAVNKTTGKIAWQSTNDRASYASPIVVGTGKDAQLVFLTGDHVRSLNAANGKEVWKYPFVDALLESSTTPVVVDDLYIVGSVKSGSVAVRVTDVEPKQVWKNEKLTCYFSTPVVVGTDLYMINGEAKFPGGTVVLRCVDAKTGKVKWEKPNVGNYHAAILKMGDGNLLMQDDTGNLTLIEPNSEKYVELAKSKVCGFTWAHPAIVDGLYYIRDDKKLLCLKFNGE